MAKDAPFIGAMNRRVSIYKTELVPNELSEHKETDVLVCEPWAAMKDTSGNQEIDGAIVSVVNRSYTIRRNPDVVAGGRQMILVDGAQRFAVHGMKEIGRTHLELLVTAYE